MQDDLGGALVDALPRLRRYALTLARSADVADDLVQCACERALAARGPSDGQTLLLAWLFTIIRNLWIDRLRRRQTEGVQADIDDHAELLAGDSVSTEERFDTLRQLERVRQAMDLLPPQQRELLLLVCVEELSYKEAAAVTGVPIGTVMSRLARARTRLADMVDQGPAATGGAR